MLPINDVDTALIDHSTSDSTGPCSSSISTGTRAAMMLLNEAVEPPTPDEARKAEKADSIASQLNLVDLDTHEGESIFFRLNTSATPNPTMTPPLVDDSPIEQTDLRDTAQRDVDLPEQLLLNLIPKANAGTAMATPPLRSYCMEYEMVQSGGESSNHHSTTPPLKSTANAVSSPAVTAPLITPECSCKGKGRENAAAKTPDEGRPIQLLNHHTSSTNSDTHNKTMNPSIGDETIVDAMDWTPAPAPTALAARTIEDHIADLKRLRPANHQGPAKRQKNHLLDELSSQNQPYRVADLPNIKLSTLGEDGGPDSEDGAEDDDEDEAQPTSRYRKVTERKRRLNAIADSYVQERTQKLIKKGNLVRPQDEAIQSARWMVNQAESRQIISTPREYQVELFERAKEKNIIAVLDTGSGKTLVAVLLLRHIFAQELEDRALGKPNRISFFLVDSVTLVFQQHAVLKANLDQPMDMFCGDMGCDLWSRGLWEKHFAKNMVIVCTAEVLRQCLHHSFISMDRINLLIFDEAHHAKKDHAYARIIKDFYAQEKSAVLPKILGMTASPVDARVDVRKAAAELEGILHCEIATAADSSLLQYTVNSKQEQLAKYAALGPKFETPLYSQMHERFKSNGVLRKPLIYSYEATRELGAWCADEVWAFCLGEEEAKKLQAKTERQYHARKIQDPIEVLEKHKSQLQEAQELVKSHTFDPPDYRHMSETSKNLSSKVVLLIRYLRERFERPTDDKCIVFVKQRYTARLLAKLFSHPNIGTPHLFVGTLVSLPTPPLSLPH